MQPFSIYFPLPSPKRFAPPHLSYDHGNSSFNTDFGIDIPTLNYDLKKIRAYHKTSWIFNKRLQERKFFLTWIFCPTLLY